MVVWTTGNEEQALSMPFYIYVDLKNSYFSKGIRMTKLFKVELSVKGILDISCEKLPARTATTHSC